MDQVHKAVNRHASRSIVDQRPWPGGALAGVGRVGALVHIFSPRELLEEGKAEGNLTAEMDGGGVAWFGRVRKMNGGGV
jgi:hypothetical protein